MKIVVFGSESRLGAVIGDRVLDLANAAQLDASERNHQLITGSLLGLIEAGDRGLDLARSLVDRYADSGRPDLFVELAHTRLHPPFPGRRFALAGSNNGAHIANAFTNRGKPTTAAEVRERTRQGAAGGFWVVTPPVGPGAEIETPRSAHGLFDYEAEVAVVLRSGGKRIDGDRWTEHVWGTTLVIDWSIRSQSEAAARWPFYAHKNFDCSKSIGPWIAVDEVDPTCCDVETRVNGDIRQCFNTSDMIHTFGELIEQISQDFTLQAGDVLSGGTGPGTAVDATVPDSNGVLPLDLFLHPGDRVAVSSSGLGTLDAVIAPSS
jgi:2-keto-4-pentenoate hydratase/2-oxohepta-3-ene-1,7-dioic acid hydratase in catechol pathway